MQLVFFSSLKCGYFVKFSKIFFFFENIFKRKKYIAINGNFSIKKDTKHICILRGSANFNWFSFLSNFSMVFKSIKSIKMMQLTLEGSGWGIFVHSDKFGQKLELRLGYTRRIFIVVPLFITVSVRKKHLFVESFNHTYLGNFVALVCSYRMPQLFTGRGFWKKRQKRVLKEVKKKIKV